MTKAPAVIRDYADLRQMMKDRRKELGLSQLELDEISGVLSGYSGKLEAGIRHFGDVSLGSILGALGIVLTATKQSESDSETWTKARSAEKRLRQIRGSRGGKKAAEQMTADERRARARLAAKAKWRNWRAIKAEKAERERKAKRREAAKG